jgi:hypothetical protein
MDSSKYVISIMIFCRYNYRIRKEHFHLCLHDIIYQSQMDFCSSQWRKGWIAELPLFNYFRDPSKISQSHFNVAPTGEQMYLSLTTRVDVAPLAACLIWNMIHLKCSRSWRISVITPLWPGMRWAAFVSPWLFHSSSSSCLFYPDSSS